MQHVIRKIGPTSADSGEEGRFFLLYDGLSHLAPKRAHQVCDVTVTAGG